MKTLALLIIVGIALSVSRAGAQEVGCGCRTLPFEGRYAPGRMTLEFINHSAEQCPKHMLLTAPRQGAPDANVTLTCEPGEDVWRGLEETAIGSFLWEVRPLIARPPEVAANPAEALAPAQHLGIPAGMQMSDRVRVHLGLPASLVEIGKADRNFVAALQTSAKAPPCICERIRLELGHVRNMARHYSERDLLRIARRDHLRGNKVDADYWMDSQRRLHRFTHEPAAEHSYADLVASVASGEIPIPSAAGRGGLDIETAEEGKATSGSVGGLTPDAYADTDPVTCEITMPSDRSIRQSCEPAIVLLAALRHEQQHADRCEALNDPSTYTLDGKPLDWSKAGYAGFYYKGLPMPRSGYAAWSQNPANQSADEAASYRIEVRMLDAYKQRYCE